jgi:hypothetical protein
LPGHILSPCFWDDRFPPVPEAMHRSPLQERKLPQHNRSLDYACHPCELRPEIVANACRVYANSPCHACFGALCIRW